MSDWSDEFTVGEVAGVKAMLKRQERMRGFNHDDKTIDKYVADLPASIMINLLEQVRVVLQAQDPEH